MVDLAALVLELAELAARLREAASRLDAGAEAKRVEQGSAARELARASLQELERARRRGLDGGWLS